MNEGNGRAHLSVNNAKLTLLDSRVRFSLVREKVGWVSTFSLLPRYQSYNDALSFSYFHLLCNQVFVLQTITCTLLSASGFIFFLIHWGDASLLHNWVSYGRASRLTGCFSEKTKVWRQQVLVKNSLSCEIFVRKLKISYWCPVFKDWLSWSFQIPSTRRFRRNTTWTLDESVSSDSRHGDFSLNVQIVLTH